MTFISPSWFLHLPKNTSSSVTLCQLSAQSIIVDCIFLLSFFIVLIMACAAISLALVHSRSAPDLHFCTSCGPLCAMQSVRISPSLSVCCVCLANLWHRDLCPSVKVLLKCTDAQTPVCSQYMRSLNLLLNLLKCMCVTVAGDWWQLRLTWLHWATGGAQLCEEASQGQLEVICVIYRRFDLFVVMWRLGVLDLVWIIMREFTSFDI